MASSCGRCSGTGALRMRTFSGLTLALVCAAALAAQSPKYGVGRPATSEEMRMLGVMVGPDGRGLPEGSGSAAEGKTVFAARCAKCHGEKGDGGDSGPALVGGHGTLNTPKP